MDIRRAQPCEEKLVLRVGIEGRWEAAEFANSLSALDQLYLTRFALSLEQEELRELREFYMKGPFGPMPYLHPPRSLRRWLKAAPPAVFRQERQLDVLGGSAPAGPPIAELLEGHERLLVQTRDLRIARDQRSRRRRGDRRASERSARTPHGSLLNPAPAKP